MISSSIFLFSRPSFSNVNPVSKKLVSNIVLPICMTESMFGVGILVTFPRLDQRTRPSEISSVKYLEFTDSGPLICVNTGLLLKRVCRSLVLLVK